MSQLSDSAQRVANKIRSFCADACMLVVRNSALGGIVNDPSKLFAVRHAMLAKLECSENTNERSMSITNENSCC